MIRHAPFLPVAVLLLFGCGGSTGSLPSSGGGQEEILVVMDKGQWESEPGIAVRALLEQPIAGMPQREARFRVAQCRKQDFASLLQVHHSVLFADIGGTSTLFKWRKDLHARGQLVAEVSAPDPVSWMRILNERGPEILQAFEGHQRARTARRLVRERDNALVNTLHARHGIRLDIPGGYRIVTETDRFLWLQRDRLMSGSGLEHNVIEGVLVHTHPYSSDSTWNVPYLVELRDSVTKAYVNGPDPGSYMVVQRAFNDIDLMPDGYATDLNSEFAFVMHGLFGMHGAKMGGPFISLSTLDPSGTRIVTVEGFVYAPQFDKRPYMRELEALVFSLRFDEEATP